MTEDIYNSIIDLSLDVSGHKEIEEDLRGTIEDMQKEIERIRTHSQLSTDYFINITHELKTPISIMLLAINMLERRNHQIDPITTKYLAIIKQNSYRLLRLITNLLDITKLDAGFMEPNWEEVDIVGLIRNLTRSIEPYATHRQLRIMVDCAKPEKRICTDTFMIERIILNLISNSIKHTPAGGAIRVSCQCDADKIIISVKDNGEGIPQDKKEIIFDRFRQVNTSLTRLSEGCGIGLSLCKSLAELLRGRIDFESTPGRGSEFFLELPLIQMDVQNANSLIMNGQDISERVQMELSDVLME